MTAYSRVVISDTKKRILSTTHEIFNSGAVSKGYSGYPILTSVVLLPTHPLLSKYTSIIFNFSGSFRCGHCQRLAPIWNDLASALEHDESVNIAKLDCTEYRPICKDFDVKGYPTLLWIEDGKKVDKYSGPRTVEDLKAYVENRLAKPKEDEAKPKEDEKEATEEGEGDVVIALSADNFPQVIKNDVTFIKFFAPWKVLLP